MTMRASDRRPLIDDIDLRIIALLEEDARRSYDFIGRRVFLSPSAVKRRVDGLRASKALLGFTAVVEDDEPPDGTEALVFLAIRPGVTREVFVDSLLRHPEIVQAWMVSGESDAVARVRTVGVQALERLTEALKEEGFVSHMRSETVLSGGGRSDRGLEEGLLRSPARALLSS